MPALPVQLYQVIHAEAFNIFFAFSDYFIRQKEIEMPWQAWLLFLYTGLALRENILRVNGSDIRPW